MKNMEMGPIPEPQKPEEKDENAKSFIKKAVMVGGIAATVVGNVDNADAQLREKANVQHMQKNERIINSVSQKTSWAHDIVHDAQRMSESHMDANQLHFFIVKHVKPFTDHVGMLAVESERASNYSEQDYQDLLVQANELRSILLNIADNSGIELERTNLNYIITQLEKKSGTTYFNEKRLLN